MKPTEILPKHFNKLFLSSILVLRITKQHATLNLYKLNQYLEDQTML